MRRIQAFKTRTAGKAVRVRQRLVAGLVVSGVCLLALTPSALADKTISETGEGAGQTQKPQSLAIDFETGRLYVADSGNHRIGAFDKNGTFEMAFGWGVADGSAELQSCGPKATPPTATCRKGLTGGGAGEFTNLGDIAVDNDPASPSHHDIYVLDERSRFEGQHDFRVQKLDPEGHFLLTFGGGVITGGAKGSGTLSAKSTQVTSVQTSEKQFEVGQTITGVGIPAKTTITTLGEGTITLSKPATASGAGVTLSVAEGPGNKPSNEIDVVVKRYGPPVVFFSTPDPSPSGFEGGQSLTENATGMELQEVLEGLPNIGPGNVKVIGEKVNGVDHEYTVEFTGTRFADTDVSLTGGSSLGEGSVRTVQNGGGEAEICTASIADSCVGGINAGEAGGEGRLARSAHLAVGPGGAVYVVDCVRIGGTSSAHCEDRLQKFGASGTPIEELALPQSQLDPQGLAVDSSGNFYVSVGDALRKYDSAGNPLGSLAIGSSVQALAVDSSGNVFSAENELGQSGKVIAEYGPGTNTLLRFGYGAFEFPVELVGLAPYQSPSGDIYTAGGTGVIYRSLPPAGPVIVPQPCKTNTLGNTNATLVAEVNPEGRQTSFRFEYVSEEHFEKEGFANAAETTSELLGEDFYLHKAEFKVRDLEPETGYRCRVAVTNADASLKGPEGAFETREGFEFGAAWAFNVQADVATVDVEGNPLGILAKGQIEYVDDAKYQVSGFAEARSAPEGEIDFGASEAMQLRSVVLTGLASGTLYHYRLRARNGTPPEGIVCPEQRAECADLEHTFRTYLPKAEIGDERAWELISPALKNSAEVMVPGPAGGLNEDRTPRIQAAAGSGEAVTYASWTSFGNAESAPGTSQYLSRRTPDGWQTENISPFGLQSLAFVPPYKGFSSDLGSGVLQVRQPALTEDCPEGFQNLYLRDNQNGGLHCLTPEAPNLQQGREICFVHAGASEDGSHAFFAADASYAGAPDGSGSGYNLYEWSATGGLRLASVLPPAQGGGPAAPAPGTTYGALGNPTSFVGNCQLGQTIVRHAISADGSKAFWTYAPPPSAAEEKESKRPATQLFARVDGAETIQLDKTQGGSDKTGGNGAFWAASTDGSVVYFTDASRLVSGSKSEKGVPDLYRYEFGAEKPLTDLTKATTTAAAANVQGIVGAADDGSYVYFVAKGVLTAEANAGGEKASEGENNLYLIHEGKTSFIATLSLEDTNDWESQPKGMGARISPDGRHLAFLSIEAKSLASYDNTIADGKHCRYQGNRRDLGGGPLCAQAFAYDADTKTLTCASCNPSGSRPLGPTLVPGWSNPYEGPRYLSDDGSRFFFESFDSLSPADESAKRDIYEFERSGSGTCGSQSPSFDPASGGCHYLISSGKSTDENFLLGASADGRDAFFATRGALVGWDTNENYDVYDAREGGGFAEPSGEPICEGESCLSSAPPLPQVSSPVTPHIEDQGNQPPSKACHKSQVRRKGSCVKRHEKKRHRHNVNKKQGGK